MASSILRVPRAPTSAVYSGESKLTATWLCAAKYIFHPENADANYSDNVGGIGKIAIMKD